MTLGLLILRLVVGLTLASHGAQKLFGSFGGPGLPGTAGMFGKLGYRWPVAMAYLAGAAELFGGVLFAAGLLTPLAALALIVVMLNAIITVHWSKGFFMTAGGYEYNLAIVAVAAAVAALGPGRYSIDNALGIAGTLSGAWWAPVVIVAGVAIAFVTTTLGREHHVLHGHPAA
jgi:putative oxidoreductase